MVESKSEARVKLEPIKKSSWVRLPIERAFELFTDGISTWWPLESHSIGEDNAERCVLEGKTGGRIYEVAKDGSEAEWGTVTAWEPPTKVAFTWHPGREKETAQLVEVTFRSKDDGTEFELIHSGWELLGERGVKTRENYDGGWDIVLSKYAAEAER